MEPWIIPGERYYYGWYAGAGRPDVPHNRPDSAIKAEIVERLRQNPLTSTCSLRVDVKQAVVILQGDVATRIVKRAAGDDCWDTLGVADVSNQLSVAGDAAERELTARELMTVDPVTVPATASIREAATVMARASIGDVIVVDADGRPVGIVTDRDIVVYGIGGDKGVDVTVGDLLGPSLHTVSPDARVHDIIRVMTQRAVRRVPVVEDGHLLGVVTLGDLAKRRDPGSVLATITAAEPNTV